MPVDDMLGLNFCLTLVRDRTPDDVLERLGASEPLDSVGYHPAYQVVREWVDPAGERQPSGLVVVGCLRVGDWAVLVEQASALGLYGPDIAGGNEQITLFRNENAAGCFRWSRDGTVVVQFEPGERDLIPGVRPSENHVVRSLALVERLTGVRLTRAMMASARFRTAPVPDGRPVAAAILVEAREELAAYLVAPAAYDLLQHVGGPDTTWGRRRDEARRRRRDEEEMRRWAGRPPGPESELRRLGPWTSDLARRDRDLPHEIAAAGPHRQREMAAWAARHACERSGLIAEPAVAQLLAALDRGAIPPATVGPAGAFDWVETEESQMDPQSIAWATLALARNHPLVAALRTLDEALHVDPDNERQAIADFRAAFPQ